MTKYTIRILLCLATVGSLLLQGCSKQDLLSENTIADRGSKSNSLSDQQFNYSNEVAVKWFDLELQLIKTTPGFSPPVAARALGYTGVTLYESIVAGMKNFVSLRDKLGYSYALPPVSDLNKYYWPAVANSALKVMIRNLYPTTNATNKSRIEELFAQLHQQYLAESSAEIVLHSEAYGSAIASAIFDWSKSDGGHEGYANNTPAYTLPTTPGVWAPTFPAYQQIPVQAYWGNNRPFFAASLDANCLPPVPPYAFSSIPGSGFYNQANEVYETGIHLTTEQKSIANYWSDGGGTVTPPGHNINIGTQLIKATNKNLGEAAIIYARMGMAVSDAFIACWKGKFQYNLMRPITYIRQYIDPSWTSFIATPPFPTYCSGHATVSGASAEVLSSIFGSQTSFIDRTNEQSFGAKEFKSFDEAAAEAAISRMYGGIHFRMDNEIGLQKGKLIGKNIAEFKLKK
jgi:hypothetical protein